MVDTPLILGGRTFRSRLVLGTGKYADFATMKAALIASGAEMVTVAVRRLDLQARDEASLLHWIPEGMTLLPNTAGCYTAGVGTASDCAICMELGVSGLLVNTAISGAQDPAAMASAMKLATEAGRLAFLAGRIPRKLYGSASSPLSGVIGSR